MAAIRGVPRAQYTGRGTWKVVVVQPNLGLERHVVVFK